MNLFFRRPKKSILFLNPDLHCSFFLRDEFRKLGWRADIAVTQGYPTKLLYAKDVEFVPVAPGYNHHLGRILGALSFFVWYVSKALKYKYFIYYGRPPLLGAFDSLLRKYRLCSTPFATELSLAKLFKVILINNPSGCLEEDLQENWLALDSGKVCGNCGVFSRCKTRQTGHFERLKAYFSYIILATPCQSKVLPYRMSRYKSIDLEIWRPDLIIPDQFRLARSKKIRIMHSNYLKASGRTEGGKNIKGTPYIVEAIDRLKNEGFPVESLIIEDVPAKDIRFYQAQADIIVDQLIYGWWGSTGVECLALGKPVVCYLRDSWKSEFNRLFPEYDELPIVEANTDTIYDVLKRLVTDDEFRISAGKKSRAFAELQYCPSQNASFLANLLLSLSD